jgi:hypothetical protein
MALWALGTAPFRAISPRFLGHFLRVFLRACPTGRKKLPQRTRIHCRSSRDFSSSR